MATTLRELRHELEQARREAQEGQTSIVVDRLDHLLETLDGELMLTTAEAARLLGISSVNTVKALVRSGRIHAVRVGTHYRIPLVEVERLRTEATVRGLQASSRIHDQTSGWGGEGLTPEELQDLEDGRPGTLPWKRG